jgi:hypothetical protein
MFPITNPWKAAQIMTYPVRAAASAAPGVISAVPGALSSAANLASSSAGALSSSLSSLWSYRKKTGDQDSKEETSISADDFDRSEKEPSKEVLSELEGKEFSIPHPKRTELLQIPQDNSNYSSLMLIGLTTAALASYPYYSGGLLAMGSATLVKFGLSYGNEARQHLRFLYPIWGESNAASERRVTTLMEESKQGLFMVKCYYLKTGSDERTFVKPPPPSTAFIFQSIGSDFENEIGAHMHMFSREQNAGYYWPLIESVGRDLRSIILVARDFSKNENQNVHYSTTLK